MRSRVSHHRGCCCASNRPDGLAGALVDGWRGVADGLAGARERGITVDRVSSQPVPGGVVHDVPADLRAALSANATALAAWTDITPLARNEFICWVEDAKKDVTRVRRIRRTQEELEAGLRRPCCWPGCTHRERTGK